MNVKFSQLLSVTRSYHPNQGRNQYHQNRQTLNRFSFIKWDVLMNTLKRKFPNVTTKLEYFEAIQKGLRMMASFLGRECSPIVAQRAFRSYRMLQLHSKLWSYSCKNPVTNRAMLSFVILTLCKANDSLRLAIKDSELAEHIRDLEFIRELTAATVVCPHCKDRLVIDKKVVGIEYCHCPDTAEDPYSRHIDEYPWVPFAETADLLIWRQPHPEHHGLFIYKVYGYYDDISAQDFLEAQLDIEYRKQWDDTAARLEVVEAFPETQSDIIYWEMKWPKMFANRDYLFVRRHKVDKAGKNMVIMSKAITHSNVPERKGVHRVTEYWSVMHIKAAKGISQPGVEFGLTYFDNPGVSLPQWLCSWAAMTGIPDFLEKQRNAARLKRLAKGNPPRQSIAVSSSSPHFSDRRKPPTAASSSKSSPPTPPPSSSQKPKKQTDAKIKETDASSTNNNSSNGEDSSNEKTIVSKIGDSNINSSSATTSTEANNPSSQSLPSTTSTPASTKQQEGKNELLSQFFKEHILEVHS